MVFRTAGDEEGGHAEIEGRDDVPGEVVSDEEGLIGGYAELVKGSHERLGVGLGDADLAGDHGEARLERQKQARTASLTERDDGMWQLFALFDPTSAARIRKALNNKTDADWRQHGRRGREHISDRHRRAAPEWCISHHIIEWQHDGPTQPDNLVLVCHPCHDKIHHNNWHVEKHPDAARPYLRPPCPEPKP